MVAPLSPNINVMVAAVRKAARGLLRDFGEIENLQVSLKGTADFVSSADLKAEQTLKFELKKARPRYGFILEEGGVEKGEEENMNWVIDPLDGTTNFLHGLPHFAISVALMNESEIVNGVVFNPITDELFYAEKGAGAFLAGNRNDQRLRVSSRKELKKSIISTGTPFCDYGDHKLFMRQLEKIMENSAGIRRFGSASLDLAYLAAGRYDGFWEMGLKIWDIAAGMLLIKEAGGNITTAGCQDIRGDHTEEVLKTGNILATNGFLHPVLNKMLFDAASV